MLFLTWLSIFREAYVTGPLVMLVMFGVTAYACIRAKREAEREALNAPVAEVVEPEPVQDLPADALPA